MSAQRTSKTIRIEVPTEESFAPFGELAGRRDSPALFETDGMRMWPIDFQASGTAELLAVYSEFEPFRIAKLERHHGVTQTFIPVSGPPSVIVVAAPTDPDDRSAIPEPDDLHAFIVHRIPYVLKKGAWHYARLPLCPPGCEWIIVTDRETTADIMEHGAAGADKWELTQLVDLEATYGLTFELAL